MDGYREDGDLTPDASGAEASWIWAPGARDVSPGHIAAGDIAAENEAEAVRFEAFRVRAAAAAPVPPGPVAGQPASATDQPGGHPARVALGMAVLAADRLGTPANDAFVVGVGLAQQSAIELRGLAGRVIGPPSRLAARALDRSALRARLRANAGPLAGSRERFGRIIDNARARGQAIVDGGRADANAVIQAGVTDGMSWAEERAVPQVVDNLVPHLVDSVVPQIVDGIVPHLVETVVPQLIDGAMPEIRARVLPVIIDDLANDPRLRDLVLEQSRDAVGEAATQLRTATATADDKVEQVFRRLVRSGSQTTETTGTTEATEARAADAAGVENAAESPADASRDE